MNITPAVLWSILSTISVIALGSLTYTLRKFRNEIDAINKNINEATKDLNSKFILHVSQETFFDFKKSTSRTLEELRNAYIDIAKTLSAHAQMLTDIKGSVEDIKKKN